MLRGERVAVERGRERMECWRCGSRVRSGSRVCLYCGAPLEPPRDDRAPRRPPRGRDDWDDDPSDYMPDYAPRRGHPQRPDPRNDARWPEDDESAEWQAPPPRRGRQQLPSRPGDRGNARRDPSPQYDPWEDSQGADWSDEREAYEDDSDATGWLEPQRRPGDRPMPNSRQPEPRQPDPLEDPRAPRSLRRPSPQPQAQPNVPPNVPPVPWDRPSGRTRESLDGRDGRMDGPRNYSTEGFLPRLTREEPSLSPSYSRSPSHALYPPSRAPLSQPQRGGPPSYAGAPSRGATPYGGFRIPGAAPETEEQQERRSGGRGRLARLLLLVALVPLLVAAVLIAGPRVMSQLGSSSPAVVQTNATPTVGPTPTVLPNYTLFASAQSPYAINYPKSWKTQSDVKTISGIAHYIDIFSPADATASVAVEQTTTPLPVSDIDIIHAEVAGAQTADMTFTEAPAKATTQSLGREQWQRREYDVVSKGAKLHMAILACHHGGKAYVIVLVTAAATFDKMDKSDFTPMLTSFRFTK